MKEPSAPQSDASDDDNGGHSVSQQGKRVPNSTGRRKPGHRKNGVIFILLISLILIVMSRSEPVTTIDCTPEIMASKPDIVMLGAWWCTYCYQAKKYFQKNDIHYCEYDMESTETGRRLYQENGGGAIPVLLIGEYRIKGYSEQRIERALSLSKPENTKAD